MEYVLLFFLCGDELRIQSVTPAIILWVSLELTEEVNYAYSRGSSRDVLDCRKRFDAKYLNLG